MLAAVALLEHELAAGDPLVLAVGDADQTEEQSGGETVRHAVILREPVRAAPRELARHGAGLHDLL